jgi:hypothetical protein
LKAANLKSDAFVFFDATGSVVDPVLRNGTPVHEYEPNTWGPIEADQIIPGDGGWHNPKFLGEKPPITPK